MYAIPLDIREHRFADALKNANDSSTGMLSDVPLSISEARKAELKSEDADAPTPTNKSFARFVRLHIGFLPSLLEVSVQTERQPQEVRAHLELLEAEVRQMREDDPDTWDIALEILEEIETGKLRWADLRGKPPNGNDMRVDVISALRGMALWNNPSASTKDLLQALASCTPYFAAYFPQLGRIGTTVCLSIAKMWSAKIDHSPYHFRKPAEAVARINQLAAEARLGEIAIVLADYIGLGMSLETRQQFKNHRLGRSTS